MIDANSDKLTDKSVPYRNIVKAYNRMEKAYRGLDDITNLEDLRRYLRQCDYTLDMQQYFFKVLESDMAPEADKQLRRESDIEKIKVVIGMK